MARSLADIEQDILSLSEKERVELLRKLIDDLDVPGDANSAAAWLKESERPTFPAEEVLKEYRNTLRELSE
jgi:hypothetical protein